MASFEQGIVDGGLDLSVDKVELLGVAVELFPDDLRPAEHFYKSQSRFVLNAQTGAELAAFLTALTQELGPTELVSQSIQILWVADVRGQIRVALEEMVSEDGTKRYPLLRRLDPPKGFSKLGHPALLDDNTGRIAGDLVYKQGIWKLTDDSGRFSWNRGRTKEQLLEAVEVFKSFGVVLVADYIR